MKSLKKFAEVALPISEAHSSRFTTMMQNDRHFFIKFNRVASMKIHLLVVELPSRKIQTKISSYAGKDVRQHW